MASPAAPATTDSASASFSLSRIGQIAVNVRDAARAASFYRDTLGVPFLFAAGPLAFFQCGATRLMLSPAEAAEFDHPSSVLYFTVDDIAAAFALLRRRGVVFRDEPHVVHRAADHELWMAFFKDTEGNTIGIMSEVR